MIGETPDRTLARRDFDQVRRLAELAVAEPVADQCVAIGKALDAGQELEAVTGHFLALNLPDRAVLRIHLEDA